ncbi:thiamine phosphate synthase [Albidovulum sp.]|uniref:thiamine phosphate synthase n=1 Tax=Albidovulum sp. TaxID=1872424 RepID=UPI0039B8C25F
MAAEDRPQIYLIAPPDLDLGSFPDRLARVLDTVDVACLRLGLATTDADHIGRAADALRAVAHDRDVAVVVETHLQIAERHGLDGVHLTDGARDVRAARKALGPDAIVGAFCGTTRHEGMNAGEAGADYVAFGPVGASSLGTGAPAGRDLFAWWSEMIEVPVVAEGGLTPALVADLAPVVDFLGIGPEIWGAEDALAALRALLAPLG